MPIMKPTIHLNGSSLGHLIEDYEKAARLVGDALVALGQTVPNGRDYYPQGPYACTVATKEHDARLAKLRDVRQELAEILDELQDQKDLREASQTDR